MASNAQTAPAPQPAAETPPRRNAGDSRTSRRRLWTDHVARWLVTAGGLAIIASILGILLFILAEIWPLMRGARVSAEAELWPAGATFPALLTDEYKTHVATVRDDGVLEVRRLSDGAVVHEAVVTDRPLLAVRAEPGQQLFSAATADRAVLAVPLVWQVSFSGSERVITPAVGETVVFALPEDATPIRAHAARLDEQGAGAAAAVLEDGSLVVIAREVEVNLFSGETTETFSTGRAAAPPGIVALQLDPDRRNAYAGTASGELAWWRIDDEQPAPPEVVSGSSPVTALSLLIGGRSLVVGRSDGALEIWFPVRQADETFRLTRIRDFVGTRGAIAGITPSRRDKGFFALDRDGGLGLYYSTSERTLWTGDSPVRDATALFYTPKADGLLVGGTGRLAALAVHNPHPEISWRGLFGKIWYEGYERPEYVWQSSGGTDEFEPKLSLTPLMVGTLKGTVYSLLLAIPLGVLGAMYTSQFMHPSFKRYVKPTVEIMAALPSVVLGFLAGLWLAPRIERVMPALMLMLIVLPLIVLAAGFVWRAVPRVLRNRFPLGAEVLLYMVAILAGIGICFQLGGWWEALVFGGDFQAWLLETSGLRYDQRNAIVVGLAMGFAVIPIIFSIAEDAFSNVPRNLVAGSLALGANRWQTVTRVVLPTASPGIFSGIIVGFGRAVGETMIVLMATGNTPIMDWNPFNGFRTLSANIAVEIPEAPHGGTLYRTLFLAALMLFVITFLINTFAELIRQRLRKRYSQL